ncbi:hypothetical protein [Bacteroides acidifaciens]|uniref:hypothetical protein n=1 Tax=Bacteroides acidifaciens TaxID=85831 RepID=UPI0023BDB37A|nr:hypothetical protein [Bacteroides acidifaciens]MDE6822440.1 hypothetical protein [Bacteroides acidifaciens]
MKKVLIFPKTFRIKNPTLDDQNSYMISSLIDEAEMREVGNLVEVNTLQELDYAKEIHRIVAKQKPDWVIASGESATACIGLHGQKKILINPTVTFDDLNNVPEYVRQHTYGFFGALPEQEKSYELFQTVYPNAAWYVNVPELQLVYIKDVSIAIINDKLND